MPEMRTSQEEAVSTGLSTLTEERPEAGKVPTESDAVGLLVRQLVAEAAETDGGLAIGDPREVSDYVEALVSTFGRNLPVGVDREDLWQEAIASLCDLVATTRTQQPSDFEAVKVSVKRRLHQFLRDEARRAGRTGRHSDRLREAAEEASRSSMHEQTTRGCSPRMRSALRALTPRQRSVIDGYYWKERATSALAREHGVSQAAVTATRRRAEAALRALLLSDSV